MLLFFTVSVVLYSMLALRCTLIYELFTVCHDEYPVPEPDPVLTVRYCTCFVIYSDPSVTICGSILTGNTRSSALIHSALATTANVYLPSLSASSS